MPPLGSPPAVQLLLAQFPDVLNAQGALPPIKHEVEHVIETSGRPVAAKFRRLDAAKLAAAKQEFLKMEQEGLIRRSNSPWSSPLHMVLKKDGTWRPCGDYRRLNYITIPDKYPVPNIQDMSAKLSGCSMFSKLDFKKGYYQIPVAAADVPKTVVTTPFGMFEFLRMPFGLRNVGQSFQRLMDVVIADVSAAFAYLDDIIVASRPEDHAAALQQVMLKLREYGLVLNLEKCIFGQTEIDFLGHHVTAGGVQPLEDHVAAVRDFAPPKDRVQLQRFLGLVNFYRRFLPAAAGVLRPLTDALQGPGGKHKKLDWTQEMDNAFCTVKQLLCDAAQLAHPDPAADVSLAVDASDTHVGAVLQQRAPQGWQPLAFYSKKLGVASALGHAGDQGSAKRRLRRLGGRGGV
jgi:hypothetical protein